MCHLQSTKKVRIYQTIQQKAHLISIVKPIDKARLWTLHVVLIIRQWLLLTFLHNHLHVFDPALKMCVEVSCQGRESDLVLLIRILLHNPHGMP